LKKPHGNSIYHLVVEPVRVHWKRRNQIESSINELDEHQRWNVITWLLGSSPGFASNLGIYDGNLEELLARKENAIWDCLSISTSLEGLKWLEKVIVDLFEDTGNTDEA
jgi:hypothetical protein